MNVRGTFPEATLADSPLAVRGLSATYDGKPALLDVDMTVAPGALTAIVGPNGAGKSTLLKTALGLIPRQSGTITVFGEQVSGSYWAGLVAVWVGSAIYLTIAIRDHQAPAATEPT